MKDTWADRDLPVLDAAVKLLEDNIVVAVRDIAAETGFDPKDVDRALTALEGPYVTEYQQMMTGGDPNPWYITGVTAAARKAVGQWPTPESLVDRLAEAFGAAAERESDSARRGRLREIARFLAETGRDLAVQVAATVIARQA